MFLEKGVVNGRADVILDREGGVVGNLGIVDYKTANDAKSDDVFAFQLAIYAAAGRGEGLDVKAAYLHALKESVRKNVPVDNVAINVARKRADTLIEGIVAAEFPLCPESSKCKACDMVQFANTLNAASTTFDERHRWRGVKDFGSVDSHEPAGHCTALRDHRTDGPKQSGHRGCSSRESKGTTRGIPDPFWQR